MPKLFELSERRESRDGYFVERLIVLIVCICSYIIALFSCSISIVFTGWNGKEERSLG